MSCQLDMPGKHSCKYDELNLFVLIKWIKYKKFCNTICLAASVDQEILRKSFVIQVPSLNLMI